MITDLYSYRFLTVQAANNHLTVKEHWKFQNLLIEDYFMPILKARKYNKLPVRPSGPHLRSNAAPGATFVWHPCSSGWYDHLFFLNTLDSVSHFIVYPEGLFSHRGTRKSEPEYPLIPAFRSAVSTGSVPAVFSVLNPVVPCVKLN